MTAPPSADSGDPAPDRARTWRTHRGRLTPGACTAALFSSCPGTWESRILREGVGVPNLTATPSSPIFHISGRPRALRLRYGTHAGVCLCSAQEVKTGQEKLLGQSHPADAASEPCLLLPCLEAFPRPWLSLGEFTAVFWS